MSNEESKGAAGLFSDLLRLQTEFQTRLTEETLNYLRRLQGAAAPAAPGTVLLPGQGSLINAAGAPGDTVPLELEIENRQRLHTVVTPMLGPLVNADGVTWYPATASGASSMLVPPGQVRNVALMVTLPADLPTGTYRGALVLQGFGGGGLPVAIEVAQAKTTTEPVQPAPVADRPTRGRKRAAPAAAEAPPATGGPKRRASKPAAEAAAERSQPAKPARRRTARRTTRGT